MDKEKIDELIITLTDHTKRRMGFDKESDIAELTKALAELIAARAILEVIPKSVIGGD